MTEEKRKQYLQLRKDRRDSWFRENGPCKNCGSWEKLELHHIVPEEKESHNIWSWRDERRLKELEKCVALCKECHKKETSLYNKKLFSKDITHGTVSAYLKRKCKCTVCISFYSLWRKNKYKRIGK